MNPVEPPTPARRGGPSATLIVVLSLAILAATAWLAVRFYLPTLQVQARRDMTGKALHQLGTYAAQYRAKYGAWPPGLDTLERFAAGTGDYELAAATFRCPNCRRGWTWLPSAGAWAAADGSTFAWKDGVLPSVAPDDLPVAWHRCEAYPDDVWVLRYSGQVENLRPSSEAYLRVLAVERAVPPPAR